MSDPEPELIRVQIPSDQIQRPVIPFHEQLTAEQANRARAIWNVIGHFSHLSSFEAFEMAMTKELLLDRELGVMEWVAARFAAYREANPRAGTFHLKRQLGVIYAESLDEFPRIVIRNSDLAEPNFY